MVFEFFTKTGAIRFRKTCKRDGEIVSPVIKTTKGWLVLV